MNEPEPAVTAPAAVEDKLQEIQVSLDDIVEKFDAVFGMPRRVAN